MLVHGHLVPGQGDGRVSLISTPIGPTAFWALFSRHDQGAQPYMVGGPPSHSTIKGKVGVGARGTRFTAPLVTPPTS
jgi:hypothetical protein